MKKILKVICFLLVFCTLFAVLNDLVRPKRTPEIAVGIQDEHKGIWDLPKNSLDVLYIGSSHVFSSVSPEDIYKEYGITGYVQASSCQRVWQSYYYLEETLYTQLPKVVVLDAYMVLDGGAQSEAFNREAIDKMKFSGAKLKAISTAVEYNPKEEDFMSYIFPLLRYHDRWEELGYADYEWFDYETRAMAKGFLPRIGSVATQFNINDYSENIEVSENLNERCDKYLTQIKQLCDEKGIEFILVKFPTCFWNGTNAAYVKKWADENNVKYLDYNADTELREMVGIDWATESLDGGNHINYAGAMKMSKVFGQYLSEYYDFEDKRLLEEYNQWDTDYEEYKRCVDNYCVADFTELESYLKNVTEKGYMICVSLNNLDLTENTTVKNVLQTYGITESYIQDSLGKNNILILENKEQVYKKISNKKVTYEQDLEDTTIEINSDDFQNRRMLSCLSKHDYKKFEQQGIHLVVIDTVTGSVVNHACFSLDANGQLEVVGMERL